MSRTKSFETLKTGDTLDFVFLKLSGISELSIQFFKLLYRKKIIRIFIDFFAG